MRLLLFLISCFVGIYSLNSQDSNLQNSVIIKDGDSFRYQNNRYSLGDLGFVFQGNPAIWLQYNDALRIYKTGKVLGYTTLGLWGVGIFAMTVNNNQDMSCEFLCLTTGDIIAIISIFLVSPVTGIISLTASSKGKTKMNNLIENFNKIQLDSYGRKIEQPQLGLSKSGVGISISF